MYVQYCSKILKLLHAGRYCTVVAIVSRAGRGTFGKIVGVAGRAGISWIQHLLLLHTKNKTNSNKTCNKNTQTNPPTSSYAKVDSMIFFIGDDREHDSENEQYYDTPIRGHKTMSESANAANCCFKQPTQAMGATSCSSENHPLTRHKKSYRSFVCFEVPDERSKSFYKTILIP